jgi:hypothetical protein
MSNMPAGRLVVLWEKVRHFREDFEAGSRLALWAASFPFNPGAVLSEPENQGSSRGMRIPG